MSSENHEGFDRVERPGSHAAHAHDGGAGPSPDPIGGLPNPFLAPPPSAADATAPHPRTTDRPVLGPERTSRVLGPPPDPQPAQWSATLDRFAPPFAVPGAGAAGEDRSLIERLVDAAYRWRTALGLGLAAVTTVAVVVAWQATVGQRIQTDLAGPAGAGGSGEVRNPASPTLPSEPAVSTSQQIGSSVSETTVASATTERSRPVTAPTTGTSQQPSPSPTASTSTPTTPEGPTTALPATSTSGVPAPTTTTTAGAPSSSGSLSGNTSTTGSTVPPPTPTAPTTATSTVSTTGSTTSTTAPPTRVRVEAEDSELLLEARIDDTFPGFSGDGYVTDLVAPGRGVKFVIDSARGGPRSFRIRYAAGPANEAGNRYLSLSVNDVAYRVELVPTDDWSTWADLVAEITLVPGRNTFSLLKGPSDPGAVNLDYIELTRAESS